ncbi:MAG: trypsin-like peptidase domain-containing protein [Patescibacteria group bacterium]
MNENRTQTIIILGMAVAAIVGALAAVFILMTFSSGFAFGFGKNLSNQAQVERKIVDLIEEESASIAVVERVTPSVVSVVAKQERGKITANGTRLYFSPFGITKQPSLTDEQSKELVEVSSGTGFFVSADGYLLTNRHVVDQKDAQFFVVMNDGKELPADVVDVDPFQDIAVIHVKGENFPVATLGNSSQIRIGQTVIAIGNALSEFRNTVTKGVISGIHRRVTSGSQVNAEVIEQAIQTDAAINPGNSGGPLINLRGEVIGINTAVSVQGQSLAFAIPIDEAKRAIEDVRKYGRIVRPWLGVRYSLVQPDKDEKINFTYELGALIVAGTQPGEPGVIPGSPAEAAGLKEGDVLLRIQDAPLTKEKSLSDLVSQYHPGDAIKIQFIRQGVLKEATLTLSEYKKDKK